MIQNPITKYRYKHNLSRKELCRKSGIAYSTLSNVEYGLTNRLRDKTLSAIAEFAQTSPEKLQEEYYRWKQTLKDAV
jgi:transcriptional regulator with XRE-family HTH domain